MPYCQGCATCKDEPYDPPDWTLVSSIYPVPKFIQRFTRRVDQHWADRQRQQNARKDHERHAKFSHLTTAPCRCSNCDPTGDHYRAWLADENRRKWADR